MGCLENKRIIVTGASRGIGRAITIACAREGALVGANYFRSGVEAESVRLCNESRITLLPFDVSQDAAASAAIEGFRRDHERIDCLVNCAGILLPALLLKAGMPEIQQQLAVNLLGSIICSQKVLPAMLRQRAGVILNFSSVASERPLAGQSIYAASKAGVEGFTRGLACEYGGKNVRALALRLGPVDTDMLRPILEKDNAFVSRLFQKRLASPEEVANIVVHLLSDACRFATGAIIPFDGGYCCS